MVCQVTQQDGVQSFPDIKLSSWVLSLETLGVSLHKAKASMLILGVPPATRRCVPVNASNVNNVCSGFWERSTKQNLRVLLSKLQHLLSTCSAASYVPSHAQSKHQGRWACKEVPWCRDQFWPSGSSAWHATRSTDDVISIQLDDKLRLWLFFLTSIGTSRYWLLRSALVLPLSGGILRLLPILEIQVRVHTARWNNINLVDDMPSIFSLGSKASHFDPAIDSVL